MPLMLTLWCLLGARGVTDAFPSGSTAVRLVVPDLAGNLYPSSHDFRSVRFGSSTNARVYSTPPNATGTPCASAFCLEIGLSSVFQADPFLLFGYDSQYPITSPTFDGLQNAVVQPGVTSAGTDGADAFATTWTFETDYHGGTVSDPPPTIDLLLRLRQLSQFRSSKDQLLLHVRAELVSDHAATTAIESYSLYGNQRVTHRTRRLGENSMRISFALTRDSQQRDVVVEDAYPLVLLDEVDAQALVWWYTQPKCAACSAKLFECSIDDIRAGLCDYMASSAPLVSCLRDDYNMSSAWFAELLAEDVGTTSPILTLLRSCLQKLWSDQRNVTDTFHSDWRSASAALNCLAAHDCPFGPLTSVLPDSTDASKLIVITNATVYHYSMVIDTSVFSGVFQFRFGGSSATSVSTSKVTESMPAEAVMTVIQDELAGFLADDVLVAKSFTNGQWSVNVTIASLLLPDFEVSFLTTSASDISSETFSFLDFSSLQVQDLDSTQLTPVGSCEVCARILSSCESDSDCRQLLPCLLAQFEAMTRKTGDYNAETGRNRMDLLGPLNTCVGDSALSQWSTIAKGFACAARFRCNLGSAPTDDDSGWTFVKFHDGYQVLKIDRSVYIDSKSTYLDNSSSNSGGDVDLVDLGSSYINGLNSSIDGSSPQIFITTMDPLHHEVFKVDLTNAKNLAKFMKVFVIQSAGDVSAHTAPAGENSSDYSLTLTYSNYLLRGLPEVLIDGVEGVIPTKLPLAFFEFSSERTNPSLDGLIGQLQTLVNASTNATADSNSSWILAPECVACSTQFFECPTEAVEQQTCQYNNATSDFARCLSKRLSTEVYTDLVEISAGSTGIVSIHSELTRCTAEVYGSSSSSSSPSASRNGKIQLNKALSCFVESQCPFGPIDQVQLDHQVVLDTSTYIQVFRIYIPVYYLWLEFSLGGEVFARVPFEETTSRDELLAELHSILDVTGINASIATFNREIGGAETTVAIQYSNAVLSSFTATIDAASIPSLRTYVDQLTLQSAPKLRRSPRLASKVYRNSPNSTSNSTATPAPTTTRPATSAPAYEGFSKPCATCINRFLEQKCRSSKFCKEVLLHCILDDHLMSSDYPTNYPHSLNLRQPIEDCLRRVSTLFYSWWAPLEEFFTCFAREKCPAHNTDALATEKSLLYVEPGSIEFVYESTSVHNTVADTSFMLDIAQSGPGSSFSSLGSYGFSGNLNELVTLLQFMTQGGATNLSIDIQELTSGYSSSSSDSDSDSSEAGVVGEGSTSNSISGSGSGSSTDETGAVGSASTSNSISGSNSSNGEAGVVGEGSTSNSGSESGSNNDETGIGGGGSSNSAGGSGSDNGEAGDGGGGSTSNNVSGSGSGNSEAGIVGSGSTSNNVSGSGSGNSEAGIVGGGSTSNSASGSDSNNGEAGIVDGGSSSSSVSGSGSDSNSGEAGIVGDGSTSNSGSGSDNGEVGVVGEGSTSNSISGSDSNSGEAGIVGDGSSSNSVSGSGSNNGEAGIVGDGSSSNSVSGSGSGNGEAGVGGGGSSSGSGYHDTGSGGSRGDGSDNVSAGSTRELRVRITFGQEFLGFIPSISGRQVLDSIITQPKLMVRNVESASASKINWGGLRAALVNEFHAPSSTPLLSVCQSDFTTCGGDSDCSTTFATCVLERLPQSRTDYPRYGMDTSFVEVIQICGSTVSNTEIHDLLKLLQCYEVTQTAVGYSDGWPTYLSFLPRRQRLRVDAATAPISARTRLDANISFPGTLKSATPVEFDGTLEELQQLLTRVALAANVDLWVPETSNSLGPLEFELVFEGSVGSFPAIQSSPMVTHSENGSTASSFPSVALFAENNNPIRMDRLEWNLASRAANRASCSDVCESHLVECTAGDSQSSLNCRERVLPCMWNAVNLRKGSDLASLSLSSVVKACAALDASQVSIFHPIQQFLWCFSASECPTNAYEHAPPAFMTLKSASQVLHVEPPGTAAIPAIVTVSYAGVMSAMSNNFTLSGTESSLRELEEFIAVMGDITTGVNVSVLETSNSKFAEYFVDYGEHLGLRTRIAPTSRSWLSDDKDANLTLWSRWPSDSETNLAEKLSSRLAKHLPGSRRKLCPACFDLIEDCAPCRTKVLPCLMEKLSASSIDYSSGEFVSVKSGTGTEFAFAVRMCAIGLLFTEWTEVGDAFQCLMDNACALSDQQVSTSSSRATYMVVESASQVVLAQDKDNIELQVGFVQEGAQVNFSASGTVTIPLNRSSGYTELSDLLNDYLEGANGSAMVSGVTKFDDSLGMQVQQLTINYTRLYGYLPTFGSPVFDDIQGVDDHPATFTMLSLGSTEESWDALVDTFKVTKVLAGKCATCAAQIFGCELADIADASCSFSSAPSEFATCLRESIPQAKLVQPLDTAASTNVDITANVTDCLRHFVENQASGGIQATHDVWFRTADALACWESTGCPFGPLGAVVSNTSMTQLISSSRQQTFTLQDASVFSAVFVVYTSSRRLTTASFTEASTSSEIEALLAAVLPPSLYLTVAKDELDTGNGWTVHVSCSMLYLSGVTFVLDAGDAKVSSFLSGGWHVNLRSAPLQASTMAGFV